MNAFVTAVLVALGGSLGAVSRFLVSEAASTLELPGWLATMLVNLVGCFAMGWIFIHLEARLRREGRSPLEATPHFPRLQAKGWALGEDPTLPSVDLFRADQNLRFLSGLLLTGFLGAFTTFSAFSLETVILVDAGSYLLALLNVLGSVVLSLAAVGLGLHVGQDRAPTR